MSGSLTIGDFSRATFLSVKTLRHYHRVGLLEPSDVDPVTGYRRYTSDQIPTAQVIRRFRDLDMPLEDIGSVLRAPDQTTRSQLIAAHLTRLERSLADTQRAVASLRDLLEHPSPPAAIEHRRMPATPAAAITATVDVGDLATWYQGAVGEIHATLSAQGIVSGGPPGGIYANELFSEERGEATVFLPAGRRGPTRRPGWAVHGAANRAGGHHAHWLARRRGPLLRRAGDLRERAHARYRGPRPRVLPGRPPRHRRRAGLENRDRLADLRHRPGPGLGRGRRCHQSGPENSGGR